MLDRQSRATHFRTRAPECAAICTALQSLALSLYRTVLRSVRAESSSRLLVRRSIGSGTERSGAERSVFASVGRSDCQTDSESQSEVLCCVVLRCAAASQ